MDDIIDKAIAKLKEATKLASRAKVQTDDARTHTLDLAQRAANDAGDLLRGERDRPERERREALRGKTP